ncbi:MAG: rhomboid family intramembrane serine protease [Pikeienuella sp.]
MSRFQARGAPPLIWAMTGAFLVIEAALWLSDTGVLPFADLRWQAYLNFAFFDLYFEAFLEGLELPAWWWVGFLSHAFLHGGWMHVILNSVVFLALGGFICRNIGAARFLALFVVSALAGSLTFGLLAETNGPMVGASGAVFGFFGATKRWEWRWIRATGASAQQFRASLIGLLVVNLALAFLWPGEGGLAWEAHLGGFIGGWLIAPVLAPGVAARSPI